MKKLLIILAALVFVVFSCTDALTPPSSFLNSSTGSTVGGDEMPVPGTNLTVADLDTSFNAGPNKPGMRLANISGSVNADPAEITTQATLGLLPDGKFHINGFNPTFNGGFANAGFNEVSILYYDQPLEGEFKFSARIRVKRAGGVSTSKGVHFGVYANFNNGDFDMITDDTGTYPWFREAQRSKGLGMFLRAESLPQFRLYYSDGGYNDAGNPIGNSTTAGTGAFGNAGDILTALNLGKEYIYEIARVPVTPVPGPNPPPDTNTGNDNSNFEYRYRLLDSKSGIVVFDSNNVLVGNAWRTRNLPIHSTQHPWGTPVQMHDSLKGAVYAGVCIAGSALEISQIRIWSDANANWDHGTDSGDRTSLIFETPWTIPAYVPAQNFGASTASPQLVNLEVADITIRLRAVSNLSTEDFINPFPTPAALFNSVQLAALHAQNTLPHKPGEIRIKPKVEPSWAEDTIWYEFYYLGLDTAASTYTNASVFSIEGDAATLVTVPGVTVPGTSPPALWETFGEGIITVNSALTNAMTTGQVAVGIFRIVARDLQLDLDPALGGEVGRNAVDYSLLQTLPQFHFRVQITK